VTLDSVLDVFEQAEVPVLTASKADSNEVV